MCFVLILHFLCVSAVLAGVVRGAQGSRLGLHGEQQGRQPHCECAVRCSTAMLLLLLLLLLFTGKDGGLHIQWSEHHENEDQLLLPGPSKLSHHSRWMYQIYFSSPPLPSLPPSLPPLPSPPSPPSPPLPPLPSLPSPPLPSLPPPPPLPPLPADATG